MVEQNWIGAITQPIRIQWKFRVSNITQHLECTHGMKLKECGVFDCNNKESKVSYFLNFLYIQVHFRCIYFLHDLDLFSCFCTYYHIKHFLHLFVFFLKHKLICPLDEQM